MIELSPDENAVLAAIRERPGVTVRALAVALKRRTETVVAQVRALAEVGKVERRPIVIQRSDGRAQPGQGLYEVGAVSQTSNGHHAPDPSVCPSCSAHRRHFEGGPECRATVELRDLGRQLDWQRVPFGYGKAVQTGELMWDQFLDRADFPAMVAATRHAKEWIALNAQIRRQYVAAGQP